MSIRNDDSIGKKLKELRIARGYTQSEVSAAIDIKQPTYNQYEAGKRTPSITTLYKIASFYGISVDDLLRLCINLDESVFFEASPSTGSDELSDFLEFMNSDNAQLNREDLELLYYFRKLDPSGQKELIEYAKFKSVHGAI